jgi:hypothetical protein
MKKALTLLVSLALAAAAFAHAGHHHLFGTVKSVSGDRLVVQDRGGKDATVMLTTATTYKRGDANATRADLAEGVRVVIDLSADGKTAEIVKLGK